MSSIYLYINIHTYILSCLLKGVGVYIVETGLGHQEQQAGTLGQELKLHSSQISSSSEKPQFCP